MKVYQEDLVQKNKEVPAGEAEGTVTSPPRRSTHSTGDLSPSRRDRRNSDESSPRKFNAENEKQEDNVASKSRTSSGTVRKSRWDQISPTDPPYEHSKITKILDTRKSRLRRANVLMQENEFFRQQENEFFKTTPGFSDEDIAPIVRDRKTGKILDLKKEEEEARIKQEK